MMTDPSTSDSRGRALRLAALGAAAGVLLALVFGLRTFTSGPAQPLKPDDQLGEWRYIAHARKEATARQLLGIWKADGTLSPRVVDELKDPVREQQFVDELVAGIDLANDHDTSGYIPPGESLRVTALDVVRTSGWDK